jgi:hypothetical protein
MTVTVTISGGEGQRRLAIVEGRLVVGGCSDDDAALVRHFCKTNGGPQLSESLLLRLVAHQRRPLPWALVDAGLLEEGQLAEHVHSFVVESLLDGMCWSDASFTVARPARQGVAGRYSFPVLSLVWPALRQRMGPGETLEWFFFHSSYCLNIVGVPQVELGQLQLPPVAEFVLCHMPREPVPLEKLVNACGRGGSTARHEAMLACHLATELRWMKLVTPH